MYQKYIKAEEKTQANQNEKVTGLDKLYHFRKASMTKFKTVSIPDDDVGGGEMS